MSAKHSPSSLATSHVGILDGNELILRPVVASDRALLLEGFAALGPDSRYQRYFTPKSALSNEELRALTESDGDHAFVLGLAAVDSAGHEHPVGVARYVRDSEHADVAEAAVTIIDAMQGKGLGKLLWQKLAEAARAHGVLRFRCFVLSDNPAIHKLLHAIDPHPRLVSRDAGAEEYELLLPDRAQAQEPARTERTSSAPTSPSRPGTSPA